MTDRHDKDGPPTDLELMMYADGELSGERLSVVEAHLAKRGPSRTKLSALRLVSHVVREDAAATAEKGGAITDSVMALITMEPQAASGAAEPGLVEAGSESKQPAPKKVSLVAAKPANDGARTMYFVAAALVAAAAGVFLWSRPSPDDEAARRRNAPPSVLVHSTAAEPASSAPEKPQAPARDDDHGVEVAAVNFGGLTGAVFYVPSGTTASDTTVVWVSDDSAGGDQ